MADAVAKLCLLIFSMAVGGRPPLLKKRQTASIQRARRAGSLRLILSKNIGSKREGDRVNNGKAFWGGDAPRGRIGERAPNLDPFEEPLLLGAGGIVTKLFGVTGAGASPTTSGFVSVRSGLRHISNCLINLGQLSWELLIVSSLNSVINFIVI